MGKKREEGEPSIGAVKDAIGIQAQIVEGNLAVAAGIPIDPGAALLNAAAELERGGAAAKIGSTGAVVAIPGKTPLRTDLKANDGADIVSLEHMQLKQSYELIVNAYNTLFSNHEILVNRAAFLEKQVREHMPELANPIALEDTITLPDGRKMSLADAVTWAATGGTPGASAEETEEEEIELAVEVPEELPDAPKPSIAIGVNNS